MYVSSLGLREFKSTHCAERLSCGIAVDAFGGVGGNSVQLAKSCQHTIVIDISMERLLLAKHNAEIYGVSSKLDFVCGDFFQLAPHLQVHQITFAHTNSPSKASQGHLEAQMCCTLNAHLWMTCSDVLSSQRIDEPCISPSNNGICVAKGLETSRGGIGSWRGLMDLLICAGRLSVPVATVGRAWIQRQGLWHQQGDW